MQNIYPAYWEDSDFWRRIQAAGFADKVYEDSRFWHGWRHENDITGQSSSIFLDKNNSRVTFAAIRRAMDHFTIPYLRKKWNCPALTGGDVGEWR